MRLLAIVALAFCPILAADPLEDILSRMDRASASFKGMSGHITQTSHTAVIDEDNVESGTVRLRKSRGSDIRLLVNFTQPDVKTVQLQGQSLDIYLPKLKTVQEYDLGKNKVLLEQFLLLGFGSTRKELSAAYSIRYGGDETVNGKPAARLELTPNTKEVLQRVKKVDLWLSKENGYPLQHKLYFPANDYMLVAFTELQINPTFSDADFKLKTPRDVKKEYPQR